MGRKRKGERVLGPYYEHGYYRIVLVSPNGERNARKFATESKALELKRDIESEIVDSPPTVGEALTAYAEHMVEKGNKEPSRKRTLWAVRKMFPDDDVDVAALTRRKCQARYKALTKSYAVDSHRNILAEAKTFCRWLVSQHWLRENPLETVQGVGKRKHGKPQLRNREARRWLKKAVELADDGDLGAIAAMIALLLGVRASEITTRQVRDVDDDDRECGLLWIPDAKTPKGKRTLEVPEILRGYLSEITANRKPDAWLFPGRGGKPHWRDWPRKQVQRICTLAKVPPISAHGMRGTHATLAEDHGMSGAVVADALGHESKTTTRRSYSRSDRPADDRQRKRMRVLRGGKK